MRLDELGAVGVAVVIEHGILRGAECHVTLIDDEMRHCASAMAGRRTGSGWRMWTADPLGDRSRFEIRGKPKRTDHGTTVVTDEHGVTIAEITAPRADEKTWCPDIALAAGDQAIVFSPNESAETSLVAHYRGSVAGRYLLHGAESSSLLLDGVTAIDARVAAAACLDLHMFFVSVGSGSAVSNAFDAFSADGCW